MTNSPLQLALRDLHSDLTRPVTWAALVGAGLVMSFAGAFGTSDSMRAVPLALYWIAVVIVTYSAGSFTANVLRRLFPNLPRLARIVVMGLGAGLVITAIVVGLNTALFGSFFADTLAGLAQFAATTIGIAVIVTFVIDMALADSTAEPTAPETDAPPPLLARLPIEKRGALISLTALDHYVEVTTHAGQELVLIRLADAIAETAPTEGFQIHRSHWVARAAVTSVEKSGAKGNVELIDGRNLPISRTYLPGLKDAGLFPKAGS